MAKFSTNFFTAGQLDESREPSKTIPLEFNYFHHEILSWTPTAVEMKWSEDGVRKFQWNWKARRKAPHLFVV